MDGVGEGLEQGDATWLQSREFKYATFMNRMRREIGQQWIPRVRDAQHQRDPDGSLFFYKERTVVLGRWFHYYKCHRPSLRHRRRPADAQDCRCHSQQHLDT
jgi:hypothetical protein